MRFLFVIFIVFALSGGLCSARNLQVKTSDKFLQELFDGIVRKADSNLREYVDGRKVLVEGDIWIGLWMETQPMGGFMYSKFDPEIALNNMNIIMEGQREDGLIPAMTELNGNRWYGSLGMNMVAAYGLDVYRLAGEDKAFLLRLYETLERYDAFLWKYRDTDGDGCLEQFGVVDTGEDGTTRYDLPRDASPILVPEKTVESSLIMADSYINRKTLAEISRLLNNGKEKYWQEKAAHVSQTVRDYLWNDKEGVVFDRDALNREIKCDNSQTLLRTMFMRVVSQEMADRMVERLMSTEHFFTTVPFPSIAVDDSRYLRSEDNEYCAWSGPSQGLTFQRSVRAFENYGHYAELGLVAERFFAALGRNVGAFNVQFNPTTGEPMGSDGYGPMILAALEYYSHLYGVFSDKDEMVWNGLALKSGDDMDYVQVYKGRRYRQVQADGMLTGYVDDRAVFEVSAGVRVVTDGEGAVKKIIGISSRQIPAVMKYKGRTYTATVGPNEVFSFENGTLKKTNSVKFFNPYE